MQHLCPDKLSELRNRSEAPQAAPLLAARALVRLPKSDRICHKTTRPQPAALAGSTARLRALQAVLRKTPPETRTGATNLRSAPAAGASVARYREIPSTDSARRHGQCTGQGNPSRWARQRSRQRFPARVAARPESPTHTQYRQCEHARRGRPPVRIQGFAADEIQGVSRLVAWLSIGAALFVAGPAVYRCGAENPLRSGFFAAGRHSLHAVRTASKRRGRALSRGAQRLQKRGIYQRNAPPAPHLL